MTDGPFRTPSRPPAVLPYPSWGTVQVIGFICFVAGVSIPGIGIECTGSWHRATECPALPPPPEPPPPPPPFCETACETIGYRAIRSIRDDDGTRRSPTCVCGNERTVITLYAGGDVGRWDVAP